MDYISLENWDMIRDVIGMMICIISILCLVKGKREFKGIFLNELGKKAIPDTSRQIKLANRPQRNAGKRENYASDLKKKRLKKKSLDRSLIRQPKTERLKIISQSHGISRTVRRTEKNQHKKLDADLYELIKDLAKSGLSEIDIQKRLGLPRAEIELVLKIDRLIRLRKNNRLDTIRNAVNL